MNTEEIIAAIGEWSKLFEKTLTGLVEALDKRIRDLQSGLLWRILAEIGDWFDYDGKRLKKTPGNIKNVSKLDALFTKFGLEHIDKELQVFAEELLTVAGLSIDYYSVSGQKVKAEQIARSIELLRAVIGIDKDGALISGGYLDALGKSVEVRTELRNYVVQSIVNKRSLSDFQKGFRLLIDGSADIDGVLQRYWRQYAYDTFNQAHEIVSANIAEELELQYFIYQGSIIPNTRNFCRKKAGKVFSKAEAANWKNDPDLIDKKTVAVYTFLDRGRYNCRHFLNWISNDLAMQLRPDLKK